MNCGQFRTANIFRSPGRPRAPTRWWTGCWITRAAFLEELDEFIARVIQPLQASGDNERFFDHRREDARTDWDRNGLPNAEWEALLAEARRLAIEAGIYSYPFPAEHGGRDGSNLGMAIIREHLAAKGLGLHNDLQNEHSIVGNNVGLLLMLEYGSDAQRADWKT